MPPRASLMSSSAPSVLPRPAEPRSKILQVCRPPECYDHTMNASGFTLFETAIGHCGVAWGEQGIVGVQLPEASVPETRERMLHRFPTAAESAPPAEVQTALDRIAALLHG